MVGESADEDTEVQGGEEGTRVVSGQEEVETVERTVARCKRELDWQHYVSTHSVPRSIPTVSDTRSSALTTRSFPLSSVGINHV